MEVKISKDLEDLIPRFLEKRKKEIKDMKYFINENEISKGEILAHGLKGVFGSYGFENIYLLICKIDDLLKENKKNKALESIILLEKNINELEIIYVDEEI